MPQYCYKCECCGRKAIFFLSVADRNSPPPVVCGPGEPQPYCRLVRDILAEQGSDRGDYQKPILSISMAFDSQDVAEHRRRHPGVELVVDRAGRTAYPKFTSLSQKRKYLKQRHWHDINS